MNIMIRARKNLDFSTKLSPQGTKEEICKHIYQFSFLFTRVWILKLSLNIKRKLRCCSRSKPLFPGVRIESTEISLLHVIYL